MIFNFNYNKAIQQAKKIEDIAQEMRTMANTAFTNAVNSIDSIWDGDSSVIYLRHCAQTKNQIIVKANDLDNLARRMRNVARVLKEAEDRVIKDILSIFG